MIYYKNFLIKNISTYKLSEFWENLLCSGVARLGSVAAIVITVALNVEAQADLECGHILKFDLRWPHSRVIILDNG